MAAEYSRFVWFEHIAAERDQARTFYAEVLPWTIDDVEMGMAEPYPMIKAGEAPVGGFTAPPKDGIPPHWVGYLSVPDVAAAAAAITEAGGKALMDAFDVPNVGRMQPVADPQGGALFLFTPADGDQTAAEGPGSFHWHELWADDPQKAAAFYAETLGFETEATEMPTGTYYLLKSGDAPIAGIMKKPDAAIPTHWMPYVEVDNADDAVKRAASNGGELLGEVMEVPDVGRFGIVRDPLGATLGLITPAR